MFSINYINAINNNGKDTREKHTTNKQAGYYVRKKLPFRGNNTSGLWANNKYIVYSYGYYPLFINDNNLWYANKDKYSVTTSKHYTQLKPDNIYKYLDLASMKDLVNDSNLQVITKY